ncbi:hypothetical protein TNCV_3302321 [Trichonephila clavipes]|nr:hypothetical protein TNCV_3302321 [Trichonephila clavipes]
MELGYWNSLQLVGYSRLNVFQCPKMMSLEVILQFRKEEKVTSRVNKGAEEQQECSYWPRNGSLRKVFRNHFGTDLSHLQFIGLNLMNGGVIQIQLFPNHSDCQAKI